MKLLSHFTVSPVLFLRVFQNPERHQFKTVIHPAHLASTFIEFIIPPELEPLTNYLDYLVMECVAEFSTKILPTDPQLQKNRAEMENFLKFPQEARG